MVKSAAAIRWALAAILTLQTNVTANSTSMHKTISILILSAVISYPLFGQNRDKVIEKILPVPESNKHLDIPKYDNGKPFIYWHYCKKKEAYFNLIRPELSNDSFIFRVWVTSQSKKKSQRHDLFEMRYSNNEWSAQVIDMSVDYKKSKNEELITNHTITKVSPISNWKTVIDSLLFFKVDSLPTDEKLPNYTTKSSNYANRAPTFSFEYSTPALYRFYQYNNVWAIQDYYWQAENVVRINNLLDREFKLDSLAYDFYLKKVKK